MDPDIAGDVPGGFGDGGGGVWIDDAVAWDEEGGGGVVAFVVGDWGGEGVLEGDAGEGVARNRGDGWVECVDLLCGLAGLDWRSQDHGHGCQSEGGNETAPFIERD